MAQIHTKFSTEQIKVLYTSYEQGHISRSEIENTLGIGKTRFFALLKQFRNPSSGFSIDYQRKSPARLSVEVEDMIQTELLREKELVEDSELPISSYNYAALADRLKKGGVQVSTTTIIKRAIRLGCYQAKKKKKALHDREVITCAAGDLIQHDASLHKWSPYASEKWTLISSLDDYSRMLMYADLVASETSWAHIQAVQYLMQSFGIPHQYYVDNLRVFRFIQHRDSVWKNLVLGTDDVNTQWRQVLALMNTHVIYALSPQAKGKIERPYRWMQDRIVRTCALEHITSLADAPVVLREEVHRYNYLQVHSTTQEIPAIRFEKARQEYKSLFRPFILPKPFTSAKDVFCIRLKRIADGYRKISIAGHSFQIPGIEPREEVEVHFVPDETKDLVELRFWSGMKLVHTVNMPFAQLGATVHFSSFVEFTFEVFLTYLCYDILMTSKTYHHGNLKEALISAGLEILSEKGIEGLSLRKVAKRVGVSHTAPYNHFSDKQALLAAISTAGHDQLYQTLLNSFEESKHSSTDIIYEIAWSYLEFALASPSMFKLMFSGALEEERAHPEYVEISMKNISLLEEIIIYCQNKGQLKEGKVEIVAIKLWSSVHGFTNLILEDQFPKEYLQDQNLKDQLKIVIS